MHLDQSIIPCALRSYLCSLHQTLTAVLKSGSESETQERGDIEEKMREISILQLQCYARDSIDDLGHIRQVIQSQQRWRYAVSVAAHIFHSTKAYHFLIFTQQELELLSHMEDLRELEELSEQELGSSGGGSAGGEGTSREFAVEGLPRLGDRLPPVPGDGPGISIQRTEKVGDQLIIRYSY